MVIAVTQNDIKHGERFMCRTCPIALAIGRATSRMVWVERNHVAVDGSTIGEAIVFAELPMLAQNFIKAFDKGRQVRPFSFCIDIPVEVPCQ